MQGTVTAPTFIGELTGNASTVTTNANLTGDVTSSGSNATTIGASKVFSSMIADGTVAATDMASDAVITAKILNANVTYAKIQNVSATDKVLGRTTTGAGIVEEISTTGSGNVVRATSPTLVTPVLGAATGASLNLTGGVTGGNSETSTISGFAANMNTQTGTTYTLTAADNGKIITLNNASAITLTVPALFAGFNSMLVQLGAGQVTLTASGVTINNRSSYTKTAGANAIVTLIGLSSTTFISAGDMQ
jgi:hypothetical protein